MLQVILYNTHREGALVPQGLGCAIDPEEAAQKILATAGLKIKSAEKVTDALFFMSTAQAQALAKLAHEDPETIKNKPSKDAKKSAHNALIGK
jgi:hypothetical protein